MYELDPSDSFCFADSLRAPATMLEALQFMVAQLSELLLPNSRELPPASVEGIRAQIWEKHESALRAELEERFSRLRARLDLDQFTSVINQVLASPSAHTLPVTVSEALTEQLTEELRAQLGQRFAHAHDHLDSIGLSDLIDQALEGSSQKEISDTLRDEIRQEEASRYNLLLLVARNRAFTEAMDLAVSDGQATADIVCADDRAILADLFRVQAEELEARKARMMEEHNRRVAALERKLESSHNKLEHSLEDKLALCGSGIDKQRIELTNALRAMEEEREREFVRDHAVQLGLRSLHDVDDLRAAKRARNLPCSANSEAAARSRSRSVSMASEPRKRGRSPSPPAASKALVEYPSSDPSQGAPEEDDTTPTASPTVPRPHEVMVEHISIHADNPDRTSASSIHAPGSQMVCDAPATTAEVASARDAVPQTLSLSDDCLASLVGIIQTSIQNQCTPIRQQLATLSKKVEDVISRSLESLPRPNSGESHGPHIPPPVKAMAAAKERADVAPAPAGSSGPRERRQTPPSLPSAVVDAGRPVPSAQGLSSSAKGEGQHSHRFTQRPEPSSLNTPERNKPDSVQVEAVPPVPNVPTAGLGSGPGDARDWGLLEASQAVADTDFPLPSSKPLTKSQRARAATKARKAAAAVANASVPGYIPPPTNPNNSTISTSRIAPTWMRTATADMIKRHQADTGFRMVAAKAQNRTGAGFPKKNSPAPTGSTDVTVIRKGGFTDKDQEAIFRKRDPALFVQAAQRVLNLRSKFPPTLLKGRWSTTSDTTGNFMYTISGDIDINMLKSLRACLCEPFPGADTIVPVSGWTWAQLRRVPNADDNGTIFDGAQLLSALQANPCFKDAFFPVPLAWLGNPANFKHNFAEISFAYVEKNKEVTQRASREGVCMFGHQVQFVHCGASAMVKQCSRCHSLRHFTTQCSLPKDAVVCAKCGKHHAMSDHDAECNGPHRSLGKCDCVLTCLLCKQRGHHARARACPLRQDYVAALTTGSVTPRQGPAQPPVQANAAPPATSTSRPRARRLPKPPLDSANVPVERCDDAPKQMSASLAAALEAAHKKIGEDLMQLDEPVQASLKDQLRNSILNPTPNSTSSAGISVPFPVQRPRPPVASLSDTQVDVELSYENIARFDDELVVIDVMENGEVEDKLDYKYYLELRRAARFRFEEAMKADEEEVMREFSEPGVGPPSLSHGPLPTVGTRPLSLPIYPHDVPEAQMGPPTSANLTAPNHNV